MTTTTATIKGQVTIPAALRRKLNIIRGTKLKVVEKNGKIIMEPLPDDVIKAGRGILKTKGKAIKHLLADRKFEADR
ncbi:MAG: AbrB/MazE/SpoVT family DNA-binding domain-containing protein [Desulfobulbaceae bacterium]|nr:AbrB/MazE/SpoVT family DNA-binding domain-containing protein [Desulfobulbaceae bacterium]